MYTKLKKPKPIPNHHLCECGKCGILVASNRRFVSGHNGCERKGKHLTKSHIESLTIAQNKPETKIKRSISLKNTLSKPEVKARLSKIQKEVQNRPEVKDKLSKSEIIAQNRPEVKEKISLARKIGDLKIETREKRASAAKECQNRLEVKMKIAQSAKITNATLESKTKRSKAGKNMWQNPEYRARQLKAIANAQTIKPNKPETFLIETFEEWYPKEWKYTGDFSFIVNGKCPDFVNCNGQKKIIEFNGSYWHRNDILGEREKIFAEFGYDTLIIWDHELKDMNELKSKVDLFMIKENPYSKHYALT